jgi:hypothetical protein
MKRLLSALLCFFYVFSPSIASSEIIKGHFNRLSLMRTMAEDDGNNQAVTNIDYISDTPNGEYFEVDNSNPPIESLIYKIDKTKQKKPLRTARDESIIIFYFHRVDNFASAYFKTVDLLISNQINPLDAISKFEKINTEFTSNRATLYRAISACFIAAKKPNKAVYFAKQASYISKQDQKSFILMSIGKYGSKNLSASKSFFDEAKKLDPTLKQSQNSWELQYVSEKEPKIFLEWANKLNVKHFMPFEPK